MSVILGVFLSAIGYPKQVIVFILTLCLIDIVSKWYSVVVIKYGRFSFYHFFNAWRCKHLNSRAIKNGVGVKIFIYVPMLYIAHKASITDELFFGEVISNTLYSLLILIETISILENMVDSGLDRLKPILFFFRKKQEQISEMPIEEVKKAVK
jgi:phage-related holin